MQIRPRILWAFFALPLIVSASQVSAAGQLAPGDFVTFILPENSSLPEPHDPDVRLGVGGSQGESMLTHVRRQLSVSPSPR